MAKTVQAPADQAPVVRQFQRFDSIAEARRHSAIQRFNQEIRSAERSILAQPINGAGFQDQHRQRMIAQVTEVIATKREKMRFLEQLMGDDLVTYFCLDLIQGQSPLAGEVLINGEPLARGGYVQPVAPGMSR